MEKTASAKRPGRYSYHWLLFADDLPGAGYGVTVQRLVTPGLCKLLLLPFLADSHPDGEILGVGPSIPARQGRSCGRADAVRCGLWSVILGGVTNLYATTISRQ